MSPTDERKVRFRRRLAAAIRESGRKAVTRPDGTLRREDDAVSQGGLTKILSGERDNPGLFTVKQIADDAGTTVGYLLGEDGYSVPPEVREMVAGVLSLPSDDDKRHILEFMSWLTSAIHVRHSGDATPTERESVVDGDQVWGGVPVQTNAKAGHRTETE